MTAPSEGPRQLRGGFTTGTAATAAALAAASALAGRTVPRSVEVRLPDGETLAVAIGECSLLNAGEAVATVIKDGGDDPDVTNGAEIGVIARRLGAAGQLRVIGGQGVGMVTRRGLAVPPGQWAINPGPRAMLRDNLAPLLGQGELPGLEVEIFVERGEELAAHTLNPRLGITGGLSILGTTGLVKPFSNEAYIATVGAALSVASAMGLPEVVLTTGRQSEALAMARRGALPEESFVQIADFFGDSLELAAKFAFKTVGLAVFFGKAVKQGRGHRNTHAHRNDQDLAALAGDLTSISPPSAAAVKRALTARAALEALAPAERGPAASQVAAMALASARRFLGPGPALWMMIFGYDGGLLAEARA